MANRKRQFWAEDTAKKMAAEEAEKWQFEKSTLKEFLERVIKIALYRGYEQHERAVLRNRRKQQQMR